MSGLLHWMCCADRRRARSPDGAPTGITFINEAFLSGEPGTCNKTIPLENEGFFVGHELHIANPVGWEGQSMQWSDAESMQWDGGETITTEPQDEKSSENILFPPDGQADGDGDSIMKAILDVQFQLTEENNGTLQDEITRSHGDTQTEATLASSVGDKGEVPNRDKPLSTYEGNDSDSCEKYPEETKGTWEDNENESKSKVDAAESDDATDTIEPIASAELTASDSHVISGEALTSTECLCDPTNNDGSGCMQHERQSPSLPPSDEVTESRSIVEQPSSYDNLGFSLEDETDISPFVAITATAALTSNSPVNTQCTSCELQPTIDSASEQTLQSRLANILEKYRVACTFDTQELDAVVSELCRNGISYSTSSVGYSCVSLLVEAGYVAGLRSLHDAGVLTKVWASCEDNNIIEAAIAHDQILALDFLASNGYCNGTSNTKRPPLLEAVMQEKADMMAVLLKYAPDLSVTDSRGWTALHYAAASGNLYIISILLSNGANPDATNVIQETAAWLAAQNGHQEVVKVLINQGCDLELAYTADRLTLLHFYAKAGDLTMVDLLLSKDVPVDIRDGCGDTSLHIAGNAGDLNVVETLVNHGADVNSKGKDDKTALHLAALHEHCIVSEYLISQGEDTGAVDNEGNTPLHVALQHGHRTSAECLLRKEGAHITIPNGRGETPLHICAAMGFSDFVSRILQCPNTNPNIQQQDGRSPLYCACMFAHLTVVAQLIQAGADPSLTDNEDISPIVVCGLRRIVDVLQYLIATGRASLPLYDLARLATQDDIVYLKCCGVDFDKQDSNGRVPLWHAVDNADFRVTESFLRIDVRVNLPDNKGDTPLHLAAHKNLPDIAEYLLSHDALLTMPNVNKETPLSIAMEQNHEDIARLLLQHGASSDTKLRDGRTCIFTAIQNNHLSLVDLLLEFGASVNYACSGTMERPIHLAAKWGHVDIVSRLVAHGAEVNAVEFLSRKTPLHIACQYGHHELVLQLLLSRADISMETILGEKPISLAAREGRLDVVDSLLKAGAEVNLLDEENKVVYDLAKHMPVWELLRAWSERNPMMLEPPNQLNSRLQDLCSRVNNLIQGLPIDEEVDELDLDLPY